MNLHQKISLYGHQIALYPIITLLIPLFALFSLVSILGNQTRKKTDANNHHSNKLGDSLSKYINIVK
jgi:hypothetical protein